MGQYFQPANSTEFKITVTCTAACTRIIDNIIEISCKVCNHSYKNPRDILFFLFFFEIWWFVKFERSVAVSPARWTASYPYFFWGSSRGALSFSAFPTDPNSASLFLPNFFRWLCHGLLLCLPHLTSCLIHWSLVSVFFTRSRFVSPLVCQYQQFSVYFGFVSILKSFYSVSPDTCFMYFDFTVHSHIRVCQYHLS